MESNEIISTKRELVKKILSLQDESLLNKVKHILDETEKDFWLELTDSQKEEVELGLSQLENGESISWEDFLKKVS